MDDIRATTGRRNAVGSLSLLVVFLAMWQWLPGILDVPDYIIPKFSDVCAEFLRMYRNDDLLYHSLMTTTEVIAGFLIGALLGIVFGCLLGMSPTAESILSPYILALQIAPKVAFAPLFIMWFGYTIYPKILVAVLIVFFPIMVNVLSAIRAIDPDQINLARTFGASRMQIFWKIEFPASRAPLFAGLRIGATLSVIGIVVGEIIGGNIGLGYLLVYGEGAGNTAMVFCAIMLLTIIGILVYQATLITERRVLHYLPKRQTT